jgi:alanine racemase
MTSAAEKTGILRTTRALIHTGALKGNLAAIRRAIPPGTAICAAVKANAYGHGAPGISRILRSEGVEVLGVSSPFEGRELRTAGDRGRILLLGPTVPEEVSLSLDAGLELMVTGERYLQAVVNELSNRAAGSSEKVPVHLKVDTGMGRVGCRPSEAQSLAERICSHPGLNLTGLTTHFPSADSLIQADIEFTRSQAAELALIAEKMKAAGICPGVLHAANTGAIALSPETAFGMVRPGIALYGYGPADAGITGLKPVMELKTRITEMKKVQPGTTVSYGRTWRASAETWIATLPVGYADGYPRLLSNRSEVLIGGKRYPVAGTICMDQLMVNLGPETDVRPGDEAVLFGPDSDGPDARELADIIGTISYEITCGIAMRVPRVYVD